MAETKKKRAAPKPDYKHYLKPNKTKMTTEELNQGLFIKDRDGNIYNLEPKGGGLFILRMYKRDR